MVSVFRDHGVVFKDSQPNLNQTAENRNIYQLIEPGWLIVNRMKAWQGSVGVSDIRGICSGHYLCFRPTHAEDPRFLNWLVRSQTYSQGLAAYSRGVRPGQAEIDNSYLRTLPIALPPKPEQVAIADFLDRETAKIDALITKQEGMVERLRVKRSTLILQAVTGSGAVGETVESPLGWLDSFPRSWIPRPMKCLAKITLGKMVTPVPPSPEAVRAPYLRAANVQPDGVSAFDELSEMWFTPKELSSLDLLPGDVVVVEGGQGGFGRAAYVREGLPGVGFQNSINRLRPEANDGRFLTYVLLAIRSTGYMHAYCDTVSMPHLTAEKLGRLRIAAPPADEQRAIADSLDRQMSSIDDLIAKANQFIGLARESRSALITAAVTGQLDIGEAA
ncbi:MAG: restriction endonuclease subunit S [Micropruina sp.]|nr:restriction endonuclease subunit S [Micropruina sp.]